GYADAMQSISSLEALRLHWNMVRQGYLASQTNGQVQDIIIPVRNFHAHGGAKQLLESDSHIIVIAGPSETGKTMAALHKLDATAWAFPGCRILIVRKTYNDCVASVCQSWEKNVILLDSVTGKTTDGIKSYGGSRPWKYVYPNKSEVWIAGMDSPGKVLSTEY